MYADICLRDHAAVRKLNDEVCKQGSNIFVHSLDGTIMIDARSLLNLFTLIGKRCHLVAEDDMNPKAFAKLLKKVG